MTKHELTLLGIKEVKRLLINHPMNGNFKWTFTLSKTKTSLGNVRVDRAENKGVVRVSIYTLDTSREKILNTLYHELAHAIDFIETDTLSHGKNWQRIMRDLGYNPTRTASKSESVEFRKNIQYKYTGTCSKCGKEFHKSRLKKGYINKPLYTHNNCGGSVSFKQNY